MAFPTVVITITLSVPATGFATTVGTAAPPAVLAQIGAEAVRLIKNQNPGTVLAGQTPLAGQDNVAVTLTSVAVA